MKTTFHLDSFTTLTPLSAFISVNPDIKDDCMIISSSGEIKEELRVPFIVDDKGIKFRVSYVVLFGTPFIRITFTSKMLREHYFDGLLLSNFESVFNWVMDSVECKILFMDFCVFSKINDIDVCGDYEQSDEDFSRYIKHRSHILGSKIFFSSANDYLSFRQVSGFQLCNRVDASIKRPFVKFYSKLDEMLSRSEIFYKFLLANNVKIPPDARRIEITLKNRKHIENVFKKLSIDYSKINVLSILAFTQITLRDIVLAVYGRYDDYSVSLPNKENMKVPFTPSTFLLGAMASCLLDHGFTLRNIVGLLDDYPGLHPNSKSRIVRSLKRSFKFYLSLKNIDNLKVTAHDAFLS